MQPHRQVVVVGGGISGLATAYFLAGRSPAPKVTLLEATGRLGGKILAHRFDGLTVETGPDAFLMRTPELYDLLAELGLAEAVVAPAASGSYIWSRGRLWPLPTDTTFGVPRRLAPVLRCGLLSKAGMLRASLDLVLPRRQPSGDVSIGELLRPRFGNQLVDRLIEPILAGVYAGQVDQLSAASTVPDLDAIARGHRSIIVGLRRTSRPNLGSGLHTLRSGLEQLVRALAVRLAGQDVRTGVSVRGLDRREANLLVRTSDGSTLSTDAVVLATPAFVSADLLEAVLPQAAATLREINYTDVASLVFFYPRSAVGRDLDGTGFLATPAQGRLVVGCSWLSAKWAHLRHPRLAVIRAQVGRSDDGRWRSMTDRELSAAVHAELAPLLDLSAAAEHIHVQRWPAGLPQYTVGHADRLSRLAAEVAKLPGVQLAGAGYRGVGLAACLASARQAAQAVAAHLGEVVR